MHASLPLEAVSKGDAFVAYPTGLAQAWDLQTPPAINADEAFLVALVDDLARRFPIDRSRVLAAGFSKGAFMVNQISCRQPSLFRAIAPHSGSGGCAPNRCPPRCKRRSRRCRTPGRGVSQGDSRARRLQARAGGS